MFNLTDWKPEATPLEAVNIAAYPSWRDAADPDVRRWITATGFTAKAHAFSFLPGRPVVRPGPWLDCRPPCPQVSMPWPESCRRPRRAKPPLDGRLAPTLSIATGAPPRPSRIWSGP